MMRISSTHITNRLSSDDLNDLSELVFAKMLKKGVVKSLAAGMRFMDDSDRATLLSQLRAGPGNGNTRRTAAR
jgi:hypothetical protein